MRALALLLLASPALAEVPTVPVERAYALLRETMADFTGDQAAMMQHMATDGTRAWLWNLDDLRPLGDPEALGFTARELAPDHSRVEAGRRVICTRIGAASVERMRHQDAATATAGLDEDGRLAVTQLVQAVHVFDQGPAGAAMSCVLTMAVPGAPDPVAGLISLARPDFDEVTPQASGAVVLMGGRPDHGVALQYLRIEAMTSAEGEPFLWLNAISFQTPSES